VGIVEEKTLQEISEAKISARLASKQKLIPTPLTETSKCDNQTHPSNRTERPSIEANETSAVDMTTTSKVNQIHQMSLSCFEEFKDAQRKDHAAGRLVSKLFTICSYIFF
jgi:hypothetical protein